MFKCTVPVLCMFVHVHTCMHSCMYICVYMYLILHASPLFEERKFHTFLQELLITKYFSVINVNLSSSCSYFCGAYRSGNVEVRRTKKCSLQTYWLFVVSSKMQHTCIKSAGKNRKPSTCTLTCECLIWLRYETYNSQYNRNFYEETWVF